MISVKKSQEAEYLDGHKLTPIIERTFNSQQQPTPDMVDTEHHTI